MWSGDDEEAAAEEFILITLPLPPLPNDMGTDETGVTDDDDDGSQPDDEDAAAASAALANKSKGREPEARAALGTRGTVVTRCDDDISMGEARGTVEECDTSTEVGVDVCCIELLIS